MASAQARHPVASPTTQLAEPMKAARSTKRSFGSSSGGGGSNAAGPSSRGGTLFRSGSITVSAGETLTQTSRNLRSFFKGTTTEDATSIRRTRSGTTDGLPVKGKGETASPTLVRPTSTEEPARKRKVSLLRRPFSLSSSSSSHDHTGQQIKSPTIGGIASQATLTSTAAKSAASLSSKQIDGLSSRFTTPNLRVGTLSSPALHLASDVLTHVDRPVISSSSSVEALVSPPRSRSSTVNTLRAVPASPTPTNTPRKRPVTPATPTGTAGLQSPIHFGPLGSVPGNDRVRQATAPESPTVSRTANSPVDPFDPSPPTPTRLTHKRAHSSPVQLGRLALRSAASFILKEMARYLPREIKARPEMGWTEGEERLSPLRRAERAWAGSNMVGGEAKEQQVFALALSDGVVLCFLLNRLFSTTLQPPLVPSLRREQGSASRNIVQFLEALGSLGFTVEQQFAPVDLATSAPTPDGLHRVANTLNVLAKMDFDAVAGSSSLKKSPSSGTSSPTSSRPGSPASRPASPSKVVFVLPADASCKRRSLTTASSPIEVPRFIPPYQSLRRVTPPSPLRRDSVPSSSRKQSIGERNASPTGRRPGHFTASGPLTPPIEDPVALDDYMQAMPRSSPLAASARSRTPSLIGTERRVSAESACSFASSIATAGDISIGSVPIVAVGSVGSSSSHSSHGHGVLLTSTAQDVKTLKTILSEEELHGSPQSSASSLGRGRPSALAHSDNSMPSLPSIFRSVSGSAIPPHSPPGIRSANVRRVSPSTNIRPSASLRRGDSSADASPATGSPRRQVARRGISVDMAASGMTMATLVAEAMAAETTSVAVDGITPSQSVDSDLGDLIRVEERPRPLRRNSSQGASGKSYIVRSRSLKRVQLPAPLTSSQLEGSALDSAPCTPLPSAVAASRPTSPPQADHQFRRPEFSSRPTPIAHDAYAKPSASRSAQFAVGVAGEGDEHERRRRHSALSSRPSFSHTRSDSALEHARGRTSRDASSTSLTRGSAHREILTVTEDGKPTSRYALGNCIGRGQFGSVYRALNVGTGEMVAIKRIRLEGLGEEDIAQLMKEVELVKRLSHPGIVKYEGMSRDESTLDIVLEYVENGSLGSTLKAFGRLNERLVASYVTKILEGLEYLHSQKVVHCDLKAANILTTKIGNVKLSDFGVSLSLVAVEQKKENDVAGTPNWMAPEVIQMEGASTASDIWSLGCVIIELMTGRPPFADCANGMAVMYRIVEGGPPPVPDGASDALRAFLSQCFEKDPSMRPTAEVLSEHVWLESVLADAQLSQLHRKESVPFLRRRSTEIELRRELKRSLSADPGHRSAGTSERGADEDNDNFVVPRGIDIPGREQPPQRTPTQAMSLPSSMVGPSFLMSPDDLLPRAHTFVKSTFSKPVLCRVCHAHVKRSAVLCEGCTLICHASCVKHAPETCDLGAQLMLTVQRHSQSQQQLYSTSTAYPFPSDDPTSAAAAPSSAILSTSPLTLNISERFLQNLKRSRSPTPSVRRSGDGNDSSGIKRFVFPNSRTSEERERQTGMRPTSRQSSHRPVSRQSRLSRIGRSGLSDDSDPVEVEPPVRPITPLTHTGSASLRSPSAHESGVVFKNNLSSPTSSQPTFDLTAGQHRGLSRLSTRSGDQQPATHRKKESKDCVIC